MHNIENIGEALIASGGILAILTSLGWILWWAINRCWHSYHWGDVLRRDESHYQYGMCIHCGKAKRRLC